VWLLRKRHRRRNRHHSRSHSKLFQQRSGKPYRSLHPRIGSLPFVSSPVAVVIEPVAHLGSSGMADCAFVITIAAPLAVSGGGHAPGERARVCDSEVVSRARETEVSGQGPMSSV
jgi:hypothetical protein